MKKLILSAVSLILILGSCQNELEDQAQSKGLKVVSASIESQSSRLAVSYDNATNIFGLNWSEGDVFKAFGTNSTSAVYSWTSGNGFNMTSGSLNEPQYGIYPSSSDPIISGNSVSMTLPAEPTVGAINLPMWAAPADNGTSYAFKHLAAGLRVAVNTIPAGYNTLMVEASNAISGVFTANLGDATPALTFNGTLEDSNKKVTVSFTAANNIDTKNEVFYIPLPAGTYSTLKVTISNGNESQNIILKDWSNLTIVRGKMYYTTAVVDASTVAAVNQALKDAGEVPVTVNMPTDFNATTGAIEIPDDAKEVTMNFAAAPTTDDSTPLTINQNDDATSGDATSELNINMPAGAENLYATIDAPTTTVTLNGGQYDKVTATTATNTLIIKSNVTIASLIIKGGNVIIEEGAAIDDANITNPGNGTITYNEIVNSEAELNSAVANENNSIVTLGADITMSEILVINRSSNVTIDLNGKTITANCKKAFEIHTNATIKNGTIVSQQRCVDTRTNVELTLSGLILKAETFYPAHGNQQPITIGGSTHGTKVTMDNVEIYAGTQGYGIISFVETELEATGCTISGYSALYVREGSEQSEFSFTNSTLNGNLGNNDVEGNSFSTIAIQTNNVNVNVNGGSVNATGNYLYAISIGNTSDSSKTGNSVIVQNATIVGNILSIDSEILETNEIVIPLTYKDDIVDEGFGYVTNNEIENTIKVKKAESKTEG